ncbi:polysaccharide deacetylase family protein [Selenomonadales bacterium OttesenSCG-928-I06]|nr:polysaccharide deacetylase family protein [Selenomonadales bacterium OttesenSCG-928-I06]
MLFRTIRKKMMSRRIISSGIKGKKTAALTFDDGPYSPYTEQILDLLKEKNVKATFFVLGYHAERNPEIIKRIVSEGHQLGNHSYTHLNFKKITREKVIEEINTTNKILFEITGQNIKIMRPPYGGKNLNVLDTIENLGFKVVLWSAAGQDWANHGVNKTVEKTLREFKDGGIILLHDGDSLEPKEPREQTIEITKTLIDRLTAEGYSFLTIDELLALN